MHRASSRRQTPTVDQRRCARGAKGARSSTPTYVQSTLCQQRLRRTTGQQGDPVVESLGDLFHRQRAHARGGKLEGKRYAVQLAADLDDCRSVLLPSELGQLLLPGPIRKEAHRGGLAGQIGVDGFAGARQRQRGERVGLLAGDAQRLAASWPRCAGFWCSEQQPVRQGPDAGGEQTLWSYPTTSKSAWPCTWAISVCSSDLPGSSRMVSACITACTTRAGSVIAASSTSQTPSW